MNFKLFTLLFIFFFSLNALSNENSHKLKQVGVLEKFAFGSCNREWKPQPLWKRIIADRPQLFVWGGDVIYGDKKPNKHNLEYKYAFQNNIAYYKELKSRMPIIGIWDDHDYGDNNGNGRFSGKFKSQQLFLDFIEEPLHSARRKRKGIYTSYTFGKGDKKVKFILLDNRFNVVEGQTILGETQWRWFEKEIKNSDARVHFIMSGLPVLPNKMIKTEEWADFPDEKKRLLMLLNKYRPSGVLFLSGDKHFAAITHNHGYFEMMSSGLTHKTSKLLIPFLNLHFENTYYDLNYGLVKLNWDKKPLELTMQIEGISNTAVKKALILDNGKFRLK